ncbi:MAG: hypothetical protein A2086_14080 [Spirochaetes bacterium GWD1_27_9]|nr:MAG: hypothetical protein A2Z98_09680 [Spirochaetes bacterium GWB1_27_13]OHD21337.1 MAG: hypothetical protein A2Y34_10440 [Spirochaetes bacterium GWC1_27_15]OHD35400.1 MAG: hypothetical protein A2086_14080 [Spirochaetes bacterium GWD1_27_9]
MNKEKIVKICNIIALVSIILLLYWIFIFISITVFGLKVFKENLTESFYLSIIGIISLLFGTLIINIMLNLTRIADYISSKNEITTKRMSKKILLFFILSFPIIFSLLYLGDKFTALKKKQLLINASKNIDLNYQNEISKIIEYRFDKEYINDINNIIKYLSKSDEIINSIQIIISDKYNNDNVFLVFGYNNIPENDNLNKVDFIFKCSSEEKKYLNDIFNNNIIKYKFSKYENKYELYYPIKKQDKIIILYFTEYQNYGKFGS